MKFSHIADCHIGGWRDQKLKDLSIQAFEKAIDISIEKGVDFILIAGDLFNTSIPNFEGLKTTVIKLRQLKEKNIPVYMIAGSHDFSPSGKTMIDVLEGAGLVINVVKGQIDENKKLKLNFTIDQKTNAKITGMLGKKGMLEKSFYEDLDTTNLEQEQGFKIFMFHTALTELKSEELKEMDSSPISLLPKGFNYYAGGHVHEVQEKDIEGYGKVTLPGPLFPNNFKELEKLQNGGFYIWEDNNLSFQPIIIKNTFSIKLDCNNLTPEEINEKLNSEIKDKEFIDTIVTIRLAGTLKTGKPSDINLKDIFQLLNDKGAYIVLRNINKLVTKEFEEIKIETGSVDDIEENIIKEHIGKISIKDLDPEKETDLTKQLIQTLSTEKQEGEKTADFEKRIKDNVDKVIEQI